MGRCVRNGMGVIAMQKGVEVSRCVRHTKSWCRVVPNIVEMGGCVRHGMSVVAVLIRIEVSGRVRYRMHVLRITRYGSESEQ